MPRAIFYRVQSRLLGQIAAWLAVLIVLGTAGSSAAWAGRGGKLKLQAIDSDSGESIAVRMHLKDQRDKPVIPPGVPAWKDHFAIDGEITLELPRGRYTFEVERGPEYKDYRGNFEIRDNADDTKTIEMHRFVDLSKEGWWSGELHVHRPWDDVQIIMRSEDLHLAPVLSWWKGHERWRPRETGPHGLVEFDGNRLTNDLAGEDERRGGALLYFGLPEPLPIEDATRDYPSALAVLQAARQGGAENLHVDVEKPFWWDVPVWLASGEVDSIGLINNHIWRDGVRDDEAWGRPRDRLFYPAPHGNGRWSETIYYHLLNCGLKIPPSAGSASGVLPNPVGYNRVYVHCGGEFTWDKWFAGLREGKVFVTNGPLLRVSVAGHPPGHTFVGRSDKPLELQIGLNLSTRENIDYLEIIKNGESLHQVRLAEFVKSEGRLPPVTFDKSGWFLVRAVTDNSKTYRYASTGPYYVEIDEQPRVSRKSAQFYVDWIDQRIKHIEANDLEPRDTLSPDQRAALIAEQEQARTFWKKLADETSEQ